MKYIAYCRKSTDEKDKQVLSIEQQISEITEFARREKLEEMVILGKKLDEMKVPLGVSRERVRQILHKSGLHTAWKERRKEVKFQKINYENQVQAERQSFVDFLRQLEEIIAPESPWIEVKVWQYRNIRRQMNSESYSNEQLIKLFEIYAVARLEGKKLSCYELGKIVHIPFVSTARILREVGLDRMYWNIDNRQVTPKWKKEAIHLVFDSSPLSVTDIAYFLELSYRGVHNNLSLQDNKSVKKEPIIKGVGKHRLSYIRVSQIYEAQDLGFNPQETSELLNLSPDRISYVQQNRHQYAPIIIQALQKMFPEESINTPYRWKK